MTRYFTHYWRNDTWDLHQRDGHQGAHLDHSADNSFRARGVSKGDCVYTVTIRDGRLFVLCRGTVAHITNQREAARRLGTQPELLWDASDHLLFEEDDYSVEDFERVVPDEVVHRLRAERASGPEPLKQRADGLLDRQALRGVVQLTQASATLLDDVITGKVVSHPVAFVDTSVGRYPGQPRTTTQKSKKPRRGKGDMTEREFEIRIVEPLIGRLGFKHERQYRHRYKQGSQSSFLLIDHLVSDSDGRHLTLFENKRQLRHSKARAEAMRQARSYAKELNLTSFIVASPDGLWLYSVWLGREQLELECKSIAALSQHEAELRSLLLAIRQEYARPRPPIGTNADAAGSASDASSIKGDLVLDPPPPGLEIHSPEARTLVEAMVLHVVRELGPVSQDEVVQQVRTGWRLGRAGRRVRKSINAAVGRLLRQKRIERSTGQRRLLRVT